MSLAEARAAWQRTANRCLVQEDAKRAPKLTCFSSMPPSVTQVETVPIPTDNNIVPSTCSPPIHLNLNPSYSSSKWWLQMPPTYSYQKSKMDEQLISLENNSRSQKIQENVRDSEINEEQIPCFESSMDTQYRNVVKCKKNNMSVMEENFGAFCNWNCLDNQKLNAKRGFGDVSYECFFSEVSKCSSDLYFDSESSWIGGAENAPWWRTADVEELALLVAQRSHDLIDNCDLPMPQNTRSKKDLSLTSTGNAQYLRTSNHKPGNLNAKHYCRSLRMTVRWRSICNAKACHR